MISTNGQWHTNYIAKTKTMTEQSLRFVIADCKEAINTNPETPKADQYADEILYCLRELHRRDIVSENTAFVMNSAKEIN
tara:strand:- start:186 stop:425 length:240 start_codon:yes stop_codon:yes gene_type:complete